MPALSDYLENKLIDHLLRTATFAKPSVLAVALCTAEPTEASTGATIAEVANSNGYARKTLNPSNANWAAGEDGLTSNSVAIDFAAATGSWGTITHIAICDSATWGSGNMLFFGELATHTAVSNTDQLTINAGDLTLTVGDCPAESGERHISDYLINTLIDHLLRTTTFSQPSTIAIALCTDAPTWTSTGATIDEVANSNGYSRQTLNPSNANWVGTHGNTTGASSGTVGSTSNAVDVEFPVATESWGTITHYAVCDSATWGEGNVLFFGELTLPKPVSTDDKITINDGKLTFSFGACASEGGGGGGEESINCTTTVRIGVRTVWQYYHPYTGPTTGGETNDLIEIISSYTSTSTQTDPVPSDQSGVIPGNSIVPDESWNITFNGLAFTISTSLTGGGILTFGSPTGSLQGGYPECILGRTPFGGLPSFQKVKTTTFGLNHYYTVGMSFWL